MSETFDVLSEGWIPVIDLTGERRKLGIWETLETANTLREISDISAMVEYGLYRFLGVFLMDALRPRTIGNLEDLLEDGKFPMDSIAEYVQICRREGVSFDLFDPKRPFMQTPYCPEWDEKKTPIGKLDYTLPAGNNHVHFDHRDPESISMAYDQAARHLISAQIFCPKGGRGYSPNINGAPPYFTVVKGRNLFETLVYGLSVTDRIENLDDPPVSWRNTEPVEPKKEVVRTSWLYGMLFPVRRITLIPNEGKVSRIYYNPGLKYATKENWEDPYVTYLEGKQGRSPWRPKAEKAVWRNLSDLVDVKGKTAPKNFRQFFELEKESEEAVISLYGVQTHNASFLNMVRYDLNIPAYLTQDEDYIRYIKACVSAAEECANGLKRSLGGMPDITATMTAQSVQRYYDQCEHLFWRYCRNLEEKDQNLMEAYGAWCQELLRILRQVRDETLSSVQLSGQALVTAAKMEKEIAFSAKRIRKESMNG